MARKDAYHDIAKSALEKDGWTITHDPLHLEMGGVNIHIDLGAEGQPIAAEKDGEKIAVEIKSFVGSSEIEDLKYAVGQYVLYRNVLSQTEPDRDLYLAIRKAIFRELFEEPIGQLLIENEKLKLIVFDPRSEVIVKWID